MKVEVCDRIEFHRRFIFRHPSFSLRYTLPPFLRSHIYNDAWSVTIKLESYFDLWSMIEMIVILASICNHHSAWLCLMQNPHGCTLHNYSLHPMDAIIIHHFTPWMRMDSWTILRAPALTIVNVITTLIIGWKLLQFHAFNPFNLRRVTPVCWTITLGGNIKQKSLQCHFLIWLCDFNHHKSKCHKKIM